MHFLLPTSEARADTKSGGLIRFEVKTTKKWNLFTLKYTFRNVPVELAASQRVNTLHAAKCARMKQQLVKINMSISNKY